MLISWSTPNTSLPGTLLEMGGNNFILSKLIFILKYFYILAKLNDFNIFYRYTNVSNVLDTESYAALRQSCKLFYFLMPEVKRFTRFSNNSNN